MYGSLRNGKVTTSSFTWRVEQCLCWCISQTWQHYFKYLYTQTFTTQSWSSCTVMSPINTVTSLVQDTPLRPRSSLVAWTLDTQGRVIGRGEKSNNLLNTLKGHMLWHFDCCFFFGIFRLQFKSYHFLSKAKHHHILISILLNPELPI